MNATEMLIRRVCTCRATSVGQHENGIADPSPKNISAIDRGHRGCGGSPWAELCHTWVGVNVDRKIFVAIFHPAFVMQKLP
jgi:hypothetical protein